MNVDNGIVNSDWCQSESIETATLSTSMDRRTIQFHDNNLYMPRDNGTTLEIFNIVSKATRTKTISNIYCSTSQKSGNNLYIPQNNGTTLVIFDLSTESSRTKTIANMYRYTSYAGNGNLYMPQYNGTTLEIFNLISESTRAIALPTNMQRRICYY